MRRGVGTPMGLHFDLTALKDFEAVIAAKIPGFQVKYKDQSWFMRVIAFLVYPFNPNFLTGYTTTIGKTVFFPSKTAYEANPWKSFSVLAHEFVHVWDGARHPVLFKASYLFPQILALIPLVAFALWAFPHSWLLALPFGGYAGAAAVAPKSKVGFWAVLGASLALVGILAVVLTGAKCLLLVAAIGALMPWPAPWRTHWELRGYAISVALSVWSTGVLPLDLRDKIRRHFVQADYYFMSWSGASVEKSLAAIEEKTRSESLQELSPYSLVYDFLYQRGSQR